MFPGLEEAQADCIERQTDQIFNFVFSLVCSERRFGRWHLLACLSETNTDLVWCFAGTFQKSRLWNPVTTLVHTQLRGATLPSKVTDAFGNIRKTLWRANVGCGWFCHLNILTYVANLFISSSYFLYTTINRQKF